MVEVVIVIVSGNGFTDGSRKKIVLLFGCCFRKKKLSLIVSKKNETENNVRLNVYSGLVFV